MIVRPIRRNSQPPAGSGVDWGNPLTQGLGGLFDTRAGVELVYNNRASNLTSTLSVSRAGVAADHSGTANQQYAHRRGYATTGAVTIFALMEVRALSNYTAVIAKQSSPTRDAPYELRIGAGPSDANIDFIRASGANFSEGSTGSSRLSAAIGVPRAIAITAADGVLSTARIAYVDGTPFSVSAGTSSDAVTDIGSTVWIGRRSDGATQLDGRIYFVAVWGRALSRGEIRSLTDNPWQLFVPIERRIWVPVAGGGPVSHAASGALENAGGSAAGSADSSTTRASSGVLTNAGGATAGTAARFRALSSSGALTNLGAQVVGAAARVAAPVSHATSGTLSGPGAVVAGFASNESGVLIDTHDGFWAREWARIRAREKRKYREEIEARIEVIAEEIAEVDEQIVEVKQAAKAVKFTTQPNFYAEQARIVEHLIARRNQLIDEEDEELLLLL